MADHMNSSLPKSIIALRTYNREKFVRDAIAGVTVGLVALPLAMAFAISSGVPPQSGIYCAILTGFIISALGGSTVQIGGPTGAFVVVVSGIVNRYGIDGLHICTLLAGMMIAMLGITGLGTAVKFIPRPVVIGFTNGIAILIASTQIKDFFGLRIDKVPGEFAARAHVIATHLGTIDVKTTILASITLGLVLITPRVTRRVPGYIVGLGAATLATILLHLPIDTIGSRFGGIPSGLPHFAFPAMRLDLIGTLMAPALTIAMLGAIESLMSAVVADQLSGDQHNPNVELVAQGAANIVSPLFGGLPATGAIARTATNIRSGAVSPVAGMIHSLTLLCVLLFAAPLARFIPLGALAAILFVVAWNMGEWREIPTLLKLSKADRAVWIVTFALTVFADLTVAVEVGMILAALLYIQKVTATTTVTQVTTDDIDDGRLHVLQDKQIPPYVAIFRIHGPFLFGATDKIAGIADQAATLPPVVVLRLRNMTAVDATGLHAIENLSDKLRAEGRTLLLCGAREQPARLMRRANFERHVGAENICTNVQEALDRAKDVYEAEPTLEPVIR